MNSSFFKKGFTLIELLVVIAIIGVLASVVLASLNSARAKARDASRLSGIKQIQTALEFYYDKHGQYPPWSGVSWGVDCSSWRGDKTTDNDFLDPLVTEGFLPTHIDDPDSGQCKIQYRTENSNQGYRLLHHLETIDNTNLDCYNSSYWYCVGVNY